MLYEIRYKDKVCHLRKINVGDIFNIQGELNRQPTKYEQRVKYYKQENLLEDPIPIFILDELADLREEDKKVSKKFLSEFYFQWLLSVEGIRFIIEMLIVETVEEETLAGLCMNSANTTVIINMINSFGKENYDTVDKEADKKAGTKKKATKKKTKKLTKDPHQEKE